MIRAKIYPTVKDDGKIAVRIEWIEVDEREHEAGTIYTTEEFVMSQEKCKLGYAYITRGRFQSSEMSPGTFYVDENGLRHFHMTADAGSMQAIGKPIGE